MFVTLAVLMDLFVRTDFVFLQKKDLEEESCSVVSTVRGFLGSDVEPRLQVRDALRFHQDQLFRFFILN